MRALTLLVSLVCAEQYSKNDLRSAFQDAGCCAETRAREGAEHCAPLLGDRLFTRASLLDMYKQDCCDQECRVDVEECELCGLHPSDFGMGGLYNVTTTHPDTGASSETAFDGYAQVATLNTGQVLELGHFLFYEAPDGTFTEVLKPEPFESILSAIVGTEIIIDNDIFRTGYRKMTCPSEQTVVQTSYIRYRVDADFRHDGKTLAELAIPLANAQLPTAKWEILDAVNTKSTSTVTIRC